MSHTYLNLQLESVCAQKVQLFHDASYLQRLCSQILSLQFSQQSLHLAKSLHLLLSQLKDFLFHLYIFIIKISLRAFYLLIIIQPFLIVIHGNIFLSRAVFYINQDQFFSLNSIEIEDLKQHMNLKFLAVALILIVLS